MSLDFLAFLKASPTVYHAAEEIVHRLKKGGSSELKEEDKWTLFPGHSYFVVRDGSLVVSFRIPKKELRSAVLLASHIDSPCLKIKPSPELSYQKMGLLNTEVYGAPLLHSWLDRDLVLAGRLTYLTSKKHLHSKTIHLTQHPVIIPNLALHLDRTIGEKGVIIHKQDHLKALFSLDFKEQALKTICDVHQLISFDLFLVPSEAPSITGFDQEMISAYRLDNLTSAYAACQAMDKTKARAHTLQMAFFWDHEEIGSVTRQGADSPFTSDLFERIRISLNMSEEDLFRMKAKSLCISSDLAHGLHPNFPEKYDPQNAPFLGHGVVIKYNANQKYATNSATAATLLELAAKHKIPTQCFASRSDIPSGSTVGSMMAANTGIATIDLGIPSLAMHSIRETIAIQDEKSLCTLLVKALDEIE